MRLKRKHTLFFFIYNRSRYIKKNDITDIDILIYCHPSPINHLKDYISTHSERIPKVFRRYQIKP